MNTAPIEVRLWRKVNKTNTCWGWVGSTTCGGYGQIYFKGRLAYVHRVSWELTNGPIPEGLYVLHRCDVRRCVNPDHLFLGTISDNSLDMVRKKRQNTTRITEAEVLLLRQLYQAGDHSQYELAEIFSINQGTVSRIVRREQRKYI